MENKFNNRDFEQFVKQNADQYRMFPSGKVWNSIHNTLHTRRRWYGIGLALLLLTTGTVTWVMLLNPSGEKQQIASSSVTAFTKEFINQKNQPPEIIIIPAKPSVSAISYISSPDNVQKNLFLAGITHLPEEEQDNSIATETISFNNLKPVMAVPVTIDPLFVAKTIPVQSDQVVINKSENIPATSSPAGNNNITHVISDDTQKEESVIQPPEDKSATIRKDIYPLTIESVVNSYKQLINRKKLSWQIYFLPTVSYRKLIENKDFLLNSQPPNSPANVAVEDGINNVVKHKPAIGLELGFNTGYPVSKNFKITTGLQLNISKYDIKAYPFMRENARIALSNEYGLNSISVSTIETNYRAQESYTKPDWLSNFYISASLPVGGELKVKRTKNGTYFGIGSTIQPTYILGERAYLISTDFKNYAKSSSLTRKWNVNTSLEMFAGYTTGKINWKVGPQVRYQLLSSFQKKYPVKEHLIDFGLKVGIVFNK